MIEVSFTMNWIYVPENGYVLPRAFLLNASRICYVTILLLPSLKVMLMWNGIVTIDSLRTFSKTNFNNVVTKLCFSKLKHAIHFFIDFE